jgi:hypothetical protein
MLIDYLLRGKDPPPEHLRVKLSQLFSSQNSGVFSIYLVVESRSVECILSHFEYVTRKGDRSLRSQA